MTSPHATGAWRCTGLSVRGAAHVHTGLPCQDAEGWQYAGDALVLVAADGAGSARHAEQGSRCAVTAMLDAMLVGPVIGPGEHDVEAALRLWTQHVHRAVDHAHEAVRRHADAAGVSGREMATTLQVAVLTQTLVVGAQVGDGAIVCEHEGSIHALTEPMHGMHVNETYFLTEDDYREHLQVTGRTGHITAAGLFSDGLEPLAWHLARNAPASGLFRGLFDFVRTTPCARRRHVALQRFMDSPRVCERSNDDKTLVLATRSA